MNTVADSIKEVVAECSIQSTARSVVNQLGVQLFRYVSLNIQLGLEDRLRKTLYVSVDSTLINHVEEVTPAVYIFVEV